jgi:hypothetical protein
MLIEVKSNQKAYQKATKQLFDGKERLEEVFSVLGMATAWQYIGVFFALEGDGTPLFDCEKCSTYGIIGEESITEDLETIEEEVAKKNENWNPADHVEEFVELAKQVLFIAQGDPFAPVTGSNIINKTVKHVTLASTVENIFFWTLQQLTIVDAMNILFLILDAFYSTGKSEILKYYCKKQIKKGEIVHYFNQRPVSHNKNSGLLPFTLMLQNQFPSNVVKETTFLFGVDSVKGFLKQYEIEPTHHVIFDEVICTKYSKGFTDSLIAMKKNVASFWVAMGSMPISGKDFSTVWVRVRSQTMFASR